MLRDGALILRELRAGFASFLTMAYILFVNPSILSQAIKIPGENVSAQLLTATALASAFGSIVMGLLARYPFGLAPGMGLNAFFTFTLVQGMGVSWQTALAAVFFAGVLFIIISLSGLRGAIVEAIPSSLKQAMGVGIGLFLAMIGLQHLGLVVGNPATVVGAGELHQDYAYVGLIGLLVLVALLCRNIRGAMLISIVIASAVAIFFGFKVFQKSTFAGFGGSFIAAPVWPKDLFLAMDLRSALSVHLLPAIFMLLFVNFFDTAGTLFGLAGKAGFLDKRGDLPRSQHAFLADALATTFSGVVGVSPTTAYIESAAGINEGGRTGLTAIFIGAFFLLSIFLWPLASAVPAPATAPVLIVIGALMMTEITHIRWHDLEDAIPAFLTIAIIPFTFSIANGVAFGLISYVVIKLVNGKARQLNKILVILTGVLVARYIFLGVGA